MGPKEAACTWAGVTGSRCVTITRFTRCVMRQGLKHQRHGPGVWACLGLGLLRPKTGVRQYDCNREYLSHFNFTIQHVDGDMNRVADCLSHYYENDGPDDHHLDHDFVSTDAKLDSDGELVPVQRYADMHTAATRWSTCLVEKAEQ